jgi:hypothetical protein
MAGCALVHEFYLITVVYDFDPHGIVPERVYWTLESDMSPITCCD